MVGRGREGGRERWKGSENKERGRERKRERKKGLAE